MRPGTTARLEVPRMRSAEISATTMNMKSAEFVKAMWTPPIVPKSTMLWMPN